MKIDKKHLDYFKTIGYTKQYQKNQHIYMLEDDANTLCFITKGRVRVYDVLLSGKEITYDVLDEGTMFGESSFYPHSVRPTSVCAINDVEIIFCHLEDLYDYLKKEPELSFSMMQMLNERCDQITRLFKWSVSYNSHERVAAFLYLLTKNQSKAIPYSHEDIALSVGLNRVTVTRILKVFDEEKLVKKSYKKLQVIDRDKLYEKYLMNK